MKGNTPIEVMKAIVDNDGQIDAWVSQNGDAWIEAKVTGIDLGDSYSFFADSNYVYRGWRYCSLTDPNVKKTRPMTKRELVLWMIKNPTYVVARKDWGKESWTNDTMWITAMSQNSSNWSYADLEDLEFPRWEPIPEVETE
jgi:hypothetical protein